jgi:polysaccharide pyruvyl transferase WcaK-like protein
LKELGFIPYIIGTHLLNLDITFLKKNTNCRIINQNFTEIKRNDYDILMINSDQTWRKFDKHFYDYGFLKFAENWNIPKFVYGASIGYDYWKLTKKDENMAKVLLKNFTGISVRENGSIPLIEQHLGIRPLFVLDPTLLIDKKYYLNLIRNYKSNINKKENYIFSYLLIKENNTINFIKKACKQLKYKNYQVEVEDQNSILKFIYEISNSKAVITNSFHGTIFSIIFNKPFISFIFKGSPKERLYTLKHIFNFEKRIIEYNEHPDINLLKTPLNINETYMELMKKQSINYLKKNLKISKKN